MTSRLGVQSFCFRNFKDNAKVAELTTECGLQNIEVCGVHVDFSDRQAFAAMLAAYKAKDVSVVSIGVNPLTGNESEDRIYFECAREAGLEVMSVDFKIDGIPESLAVAERLAEEYDVDVAIHNHGGRHWLGSSQALQWVFGRTGNRVGLSLDTAWALDSREDPVAMVRAFGNRVKIVHLKDFVFDRARKPEDVVVGTGNLDLAALRSALTDAGFSGESIIEYEGDVEDPVPALKSCAQKIRSDIPELAG
jgi:sugar phosphate isomerase/epimerase